MSLAGTAIPASTSIDSLFSTLYPTRSSGLSGTPSYQWADDNSIIGTWPSSPDASAMFAKFEARPNSPSVLSRGTSSMTSGQSGISAPIGSSFVIPAIGSGVSVSASMPWVDAGDTVSINDGTNQFKGTVLANSGTALTVLNSGYAGNTAAGATVANGAIASLCSSPQTDLWTYQDDLLLNTSAGGAGMPGCYWTNSGLSVVDLADGVHFGVWKIVGTTGYINFNVLSPGTSWTSLLKAVFRCVLKCDHAPETSTNEWYVGFFQAAGASTPTYGALLSQAQGFTGLSQEGGGTVNASPGLVSGTYNNNALYLQTGFVVPANQWVDLIVVWTPTACRFYGANEGQTPVLLTTQTQSPMVASQEVFAQVTNHSATTNVFIDRIELLYQVAGGNRFKGGRLVGL